MISMFPCFDRARTGSSQGGRSFSVARRVVTSRRRHVRGRTPCRLVGADCRHELRRRLNLLQAFLELFAPDRPWKTAWSSCPCPVRESPRVRMLLLHNPLRTEHGGPASLPEPLSACSPSSASIVLYPSSFRTSTISSLTALSSSTTSTTSPSPIRLPCWDGAEPMLALSAPDPSGRKSVTVVPVPSWLVIRAWPPADQ